ncbi:serine/threonine protein kinase [Spirillospora sp. NPDC050679]
MSGGVQHVPGYTEIKVLGTGSQGRVVLARHEGTGQVVAIKHLAPELLGDTRSLTTFRTEAELLKRVDNPHIARLLDYIDFPTGPAILMEAVPGHSLRQVLDKYRKPFSPEAALTVLKGSLLGLAAAHAAGVVHRDYKPANVLVQSDGRSKLIDFGVAVLFGQSGSAGTPSYMAPEQWAGHPATSATDLYAVTCVFVECVTGAKPYVGTVDTLQEQHMRSPLPLHHVPEALRPLAARGLAKNPTERIGSAVQFISELESVAAKEYGSDWEHRGLIAVSGFAALLGIAIPVAVLGTAVLAPGGSTAGAGVGSALAGQGTAAFQGGQAAAATGKGVLAKVGGAKGATVIGGGSAAVVVAGVLLWPTTPAVGGTTSGNYRAYFTRPGVVLANATVPEGAHDASPLMEIKIKLTPAIVIFGTKLEMTHDWLLRAPWGLDYRGPGKFRCHAPNSDKGDAFHQSYSVTVGDGKNFEESQTSKVWLYRSSNASKRLPVGTPIKVTAKQRKLKTGKRYDHSVCAWSTTYTLVQEFTIPADGSIRPGKYQVSPNHPVGFSSVRATVNGRVQPVSPTSVGAQAEGTLPVITVLK